jgi:phospholipid transport system substrate-binding protein
MIGTLRALAAVLVLVAVASPVYAGPTDTVRDSVGRALEILDDSGLQGAAHAAERRTQIREIAGGLFDFEEMARRALAVHWNQRTSAERQQFVGLFADMFESTYFSKIDTYGAGGAVRYGAEKIDGDDATVRTTLVTPKGSEVAADYRLLRKDGRWRVWDVTIEGMSLISSYRAQFNQIIRASSYQDLVRRLDQKAVGPPKTVGTGR